jgi:sugar phosphate isomerase/epimerase
MGVRQVGLLQSKLIGDPDGYLERLTDTGICISTVIVGGFDLAAPESWEQTREDHEAVLDLAARHNAHSIYFTPGRTCGKSWDDDLDRFADAVGPTVAHARKVGISAAIEPSLRTSVSFVNTLRDAIDVAERTGIDVIADFGNMWMERDFRNVIARAMPHIALVQWCDVVIGSPGRPAPAGRVHVGGGELPLRRMIADVLDGGYSGAFDLEVVPADFTKGGTEEDVRRGIAAASALLTELCP